MIKQNILAPTTNNASDKLIHQILLSSYCLIHTRDSELRKALEAKTKKKKRKLSGQQDEQPKPSVTQKGPGRPPGVRNYTKRPKVIDPGSVFMLYICTKYYMKEIGVKIQCLKSP